MRTDRKDGSEQYGQQEKRPSKLLHIVKSRRWFLKAASALGMGAALHPEKIFAEAPELPAPPKPLEYSPIMSPEKRAERLLDFGYMKVFTDQEGLILSYQLGDEDRVDLTQEQFRSAQAAKTLAAETGIIEPAIQIAKLFPPDISQATPERPHITIAPEDVLTPEELAEHNVVIINPAGPSASKLSVTKQIFEGTGLLEPLRVLNEYSLGIDQKLMIVVLNSEIVTGEYLVSSEYAQVAGELEQMKVSVEELLESKKVEYQNYIQYVVSQLEKTETTSRQYDDLQNVILNLKAQLLVYSSTLTPDQLFAQIYLENRKLFNLSVATGSFDFAKDDEANTAIIFVAAPELEQSLAQMYYTLAYAPDGSIQVHRYYREGRHGAPPPRVDQSFPHPNDFPLRDDLKNFIDSEVTEENKSQEGFTPYRYGYDQSGFPLRHELAHFLLMKILPKLVGLQLLESSVCAQRILNNSEIKAYIETLGLSDTFFPMVVNEAVTDQVAYDSFVDAYKLWEDSGFTDTSGFYLVFNIPADEFQDGGVQLTDLDYMRSDQISQPV